MFLPSWTNCYPRYDAFYVMKIVYYFFLSFSLVFYRILKVFSFPLLESFLMAIINICLESTNVNGREPESCLGQVFNSKANSFAKLHSTGMVCAYSHF